MGAWQAAVQWKQHHLRILQHYTLTHPILQSRLLKGHLPASDEHVGKPVFFSATKKNNQVAKWLKCTKSSVTVRDNTLNSQLCLI